MITEKILCSAVWVKDENITYVHYPTNITYGLVVCGYRHHNCLEHIGNLYDVDRRKECKIIQGFLTNNNRFVDREEARVIAENASQLLKGHSTGNKLFSEDVWLINENNNIEEGNK